MAGWLFVRKTDFLQDIHKLLKLALGQMSQLLAMALSHRRIELLQQIDAFGSDTNFDDTPIFRPSFSTDETAFFEPIE